MIQSKGSKQTKVELSDSIEYTNEINSSAWPAILSNEHYSGLWSESGHFCKHKANVAQIKAKQQYKLLA